MSGLFWTSEEGHDLFHVVPDLLLHLRVPEEIGRVKGRHEGDPVPVMEPPPELGYGGLRFKKGMGGDGPE